jgi:hypothetical protein
MPTVFSPDSTHGNEKHDLNAELQAFLEAFMLMELGAAKELSKIA